MGKRVVVHDLEFWARLAGAVKERRRIRRAIAPALADADTQAGLIGWSPGALDRIVQALNAIDRATRTPKRRSRNAR